MVGHPDPGGRARGQHHRSLGRCRLWRRLLGRSGFGRSLLGARGINISSATQGVQRTDDDLNVVIVVTDADIPDDVMREVLAEPGVLDGRTLRV